MESLTNTHHGIARNQPMAILKVVIMGQPRVGKTSLRRAFIGKNFNVNYRPTLGADFTNIETMIANTQVSITLWDLSGQTRFQKSHPQYFIGSNGAIVVYDVEDEDPLPTIVNWIDRYIEYSGNTTEPIMLVQNKIDLISPTKEMEIIDQHEQLVERLSIYYRNKIEIIGQRTSAKTGENVKPSFRVFFGKILDHISSSSHENLDLTNQISDSLYVKSAYLMTFHQDYGPVIIAKSPQPSHLKYKAEELSYAVRLFSVLDFDDLIDQGFRIGMAPWPAEEATMYYIAFLLPNENARGDHDMFITGIGLSNDFTNLMGEAQNRIEGYLLNAMNSIAELLEGFDFSMDIDPDLLSINHLTDKNEIVYKALHMLRLEIDSLVRDQLFD